ncbi:MAG: NAD(P)H-dependent oxidoreductase [Bacteroidetes bacterium]|nr:NAD(P)H-dependent oxidoreductase [Bacteroidota bacterium]
MNGTRQLHVLAIAGSLRKESYNKRALLLAANIARESGATVTIAENELLQLPLFNEDTLGEQLPNSVLQLKETIQWADAILIATPEYNHSIPGILKNALDWASIQMNPFNGKVGAIFGASIGINGSLRAQLHLRQILTALGVHVIEQPQVFVRNAAHAFTPEGLLVDKQDEQLLTQLIEKTLNITELLKKGLP